MECDWSLSSPPTVNSTWHVFPTGYTSTLTAHLQGSRSTLPQLTRTICDSLARVDIAPGSIVSNLSGSPSRSNGEASILKVEGTLPIVEDSSESSPEEVPLAPPFQVEWLSRFEDIPSFRTIRYRVIASLSAISLAEFLQSPSADVTSLYLGISVSKPAIGSIVVGAPSVVEELQVSISGCRGTLLVSCEHRLPRETPFATSTALRLLAGVFRDFHGVASTSRNK